MTNRPFLSLIIPLFNEERRLGKSIHIFNYLKKKSLKTEVILVNDGSLDSTALKLKKLCRKYHFKIISYKKNRGKGYAIKKGMLLAKGDFRLFVDIDLSTPIEEFDKFIPYLKKYHVIIGTRKHKKAKILVRQPPLRENMGKIFTILSQLILATNVSDFTCGFKCFSKEAAAKTFSKQLIERWGFDSEILFLAKRNGYKIKEVPVLWKNDTNSKVRFPQDIIRSLTDLLKIRLYALSGKY